MGGKITSALSPETRKLLQENKFFYDSVINLFDQTGLKFKAGDGEAKTEVELLKDGKLAVHIIVPIDANGQVTDGRIYLRDTFVFDDKQKQIHEHKRSFEYNGRGENKAEWQKWLQQYKDKAGASAQGQALSTFAATAALSFSRPFTEDQLKKFKANSEIYQPLLRAGRDLGMTLRSRDSRSSYAVIHRGLVNEVVFTFAMLNDDGSPGHLLVKESFLFDGKTNNLVGHKRNVEVPADQSSDKALQKKAAELNAVEKPAIETAQAFIANFGPQILSDLPEFKEAPVAAPEGGYPEMSEAAFLKTMGAISRNKKAAPLSELDPAFFETLDKHKDYLAPLREAMGTGFELNLKDPPIKTSVQVSNGKTLVFATYSLKPTNGEEGVLEYSERWTFDKGQLTAVDRQAKALGAPSGGQVDSAAQRIKEAIQGGKFGDAKQEAVFMAVADQTRFIAPHLSYVGIPNLLQNPQAQGQVTETHHVIIPMMEEMQTGLITALYQNDVDTHFRDDLLRLNAAYIHGDQQTMVYSLQRIQQREEAAIASAKDPQEKLRHQEQFHIAEMMFVLSTGDTEKAYEISKSLVSPAYKKIFSKTLSLPGKANRIMEGLALVSKVVEEQIGVGEKAGKGLLTDAPRYASADRDALKTLIGKTLGSVDKELKTTDVAKALQSALDYGKNKKPEEMSEDEKKLILTEGERALASKILADPIIKKLAEIAQEEDRDIQAKEYFEFARGTLFEKGLFQSSRTVVQLVTETKMPKNAASESLDLFKVYAMEKSEKEKNAKLEAMPPLPAALKSVEPLIKKMRQKAQDDPTKPLATLLSELGDLNEEEKKLVARLQKATFRLSPTEEAPVLSLIDQVGQHKVPSERFGNYLQILAPYTIDHLLLDEVIAALEKNPKASFKKILEEIPGKTPAQAQLYQALEAAKIIPQLEEKLAAAVSMPADQRGKYYREALAPFVPDLMANQEIQQSLSFIGKLKEDAQVPAIEGVAVAEIILTGELQAELRPQMKLARTYDVAQAEDHKAIQSLFQKLAAAAPMNPVASAYTSLAELKESDLNPAEQAMRKKLLEDKTLSEILEIGAEPDIIKRREAYLKHLPPLDKPEAGAIAKAGFPQTEMWLSQQVHMQKIPDVRAFIEQPALMMGQNPERKHFAAAGAMAHQEKFTRDVKKFMAMLEGKGDFGSKVGYGMPHFTKELFKPTSIAAMAAAPLVGGATQVAMFNRLRNLGVAGKIIAVGAGVTAEAGTFTYLHAKGEKYAYGNDAPEKTFWNDFKTNVALFGAMRGVHLGTAGVSERVLATGKLGKWAGSRVAGESAGALKTLPTGQQVWIPSSGAPGVPQLTVAGERMTTLLNHGGAVTAMYYAGQFAHWRGWQEKAPGLDDTLMMYVHAMAGYNITNAATGGRLNSKLAEYNMQIAKLSGANSAEGIRQQITELKTEKANLEKSKEGLNDSAKRDIDTKINKVDGQVLGLEKKLDKLQTSAQKSKAKEGKEENADLIQLFEPKSEQLILADATDGAPLEVRPLKVGEEISLDAHLLGREGSEIVIKADAEGRLTLHDNQKLEVEANPANGEPAPLPATVEHNGKTVTEPVVLAEGDVVSVNGREIRLGVSSPSPMDAAMAAVPRAQQLSLARQIAKAKKVSDLFKILRDSSHGGAGEVMMVTSEVLAGRRSVESLPTELGLREKVRSLIDSQVKEWKKEGLSTDGHDLKDGALPPGASDLEVQYHTMRAVIALKAGVQGSRTTYDLLQALGQSALQTVGGVSTKQIFDSLSLENKRGLLEQFIKAEAGLREKIELAERAITREKKAWRKTDKELVEVQEKNRDEMKDKADGLKQLIDLLKAEVEVGDAATAAGSGRKLSEIVQDLPRDLGIRQKAQDAVEQAQADFANGLSDKEKKDFLDLAKRYLGASPEIDFNQAQSLLRSIWDNGNWQGNLLISRLQPKQLELVMNIYFGSASQRNLSPEQAFGMAQALSQTSLKDSYGVVLSRGQADGRLNLIRGDLDAAAAQGEVVLLRTHPAKSEAKGPEISTEELVALAEQAKQDWSEGVDTTGSGYRMAPRSPFQRSDTQLFSDPDTHTFQTWVSHRQGLSKVQVTLDEKGELESIQIKFAARPGQAKDLTLQAPADLGDLRGPNGEPIPVQKQGTDFSALTKEIPFELKSPTLSYRAYKTATRIGDIIPRPKMPKFGGSGPKEPAKPEDAAPADAKPTAAKPEGSRWSRGAMALLGKIPGFSRSPAPKKVAKRSDEVQTNSKPKALPPPPEAANKPGTRPTLPDGLKFPPAQIGSGEKGPLASLEIAQSANSLMGEYAGRTHEGTRKENQDGLGMAYTNDRDLVLTVVDGMGGHEGGKEAALKTLQAVNEGVQIDGDVSAALTNAHNKVVNELHPGVPGKFKPGAGVAVAKILRPDTVDGPHHLEGYWGGDVKILVLRKGPDGKRTLIYQSAEDNVARQMIDMGIAHGSFPKEKRDLAIITNPHGSMVNNVIGGIEGGFTPRRTHQGLVPDASGHPEPAKDLNRIPLQEGDVVLLVADGTHKNIKDPQVLIDLIAGQEKAPEILKTVETWVGKRMKTVNDVDHAYEKGAVPQDQRQGIFVDGVQRFMDAAGNVFENPKGGDPIDHYEADNFGAMVYVHNPKASSASKAGSDPEIKPPSATTRSDEDVTTIFRKPE